MHDDHVTSQQYIGLSTVAVREMVENFDKNRDSLIVFYKKPNGRVVIGTTLYANEEAAHIPFPQEFDCIHGAVADMRDMDGQTYLNYGQIFKAATTRVAAFNAITQFGEKSWDEFLQFKNSVANCTL